MAKLKRILPLLLTALMIAGLCAWYSVQKTGMFIDEIYTYGLSNSEYAPFVTDIYDGNLIDRTISREQLLDYLTVQEGERFHFGSVYYNQTQDVHPPLHYWLFHAVSSLFPDSFSKWIGLGLNAAIFAATLLMLFLLTQTLFGSRRLSALTMALYGLSTIALSTMLMIRMYMLLTFFTVLLAWLIARLLSGEKRATLYVGVAVTIFLGLMTQYYFVFYAFFVCAAYDLYALARKRWGSFWAFSAAALAGVGLMLLAYPACLDHLFADKLVSGGSAIDNLKNVGDYARKFHTMLYGLNYEFRWTVRLGKIAAAAAVLRLLWDLFRKEKPDGTAFRSLVVTVPALLAFAVAVIVSPVIPMRYIYNLIPLFAVLVAFALKLALGGWHARWLRYLEEAAIAGILAVSFLTAVRVQPDFLNTELNAYTETAASYASLPCVYIEDNYVSPLTQDMLQLVQFEDVFVTDRTDSDAMEDYLDGHGDDEYVVLYIDTDAEWSSGYDEEEVLDSFEADTDYVREEKLYGFGSSVVWLLEKQEAP